MTIFTTALKRILSKPINWVFILLFPILFTVLLTIVQRGEAEISGDTTADMRFGVTDQDNTTLSQTLVQQLKIRYTVQEVTEQDIPEVLTDADVPWVLMIREGYGQDILAGRAPLLEGYSLKISDVSAFGNVSAQNITRALLLLGSEDPDVISAWKESSRVETTVIQGDIWETTAFWFGFYGFVSMFTAYFVIRTLTDDKRGGMPDRLGILPHTTRSILMQGTLAAFFVTEATAALLFLILRLMMGPIPNAGHLFALLSLYNLFTVSMGIAIVSILRSMGASSVVVSMLATVFAMLGGVFWPLSFVPEFMQKLAWFSPGYWLARGITEIQTVTFEGFGLPMLFLAGFTVVALLLGGWKNIQPIEE